MTAHFFQSEGSHSPLMLVFLWCYPFVSMEMCLGIFCPVAVTRVLWRVTRAVHALSGIHWLGPVLEIPASLPVLLVTWQVNGSSLMEIYSWNEKIINLVSLASRPVGSGTRPVRLISFARISNTPLNATISRYVYFKGQYDKSYFTCLCVLVRDPNNKWRWRQNTTLRCGSTPVSTVLSISVKFLTINIFSIIIINPHTQTYGRPLLSAVLTYKIMYNSLCKNLFLIMKYSMDQLSPG